MILNIYTVYDSAVKAFLQPFFARSHGEAIRNFTDAVNDPKTSLHAHPHDYILFFVATFDDADGLISTPLTPVPERLLSGTEALIKEMNPK